MRNPTGEENRPGSLLRIQGIENKCRRMKIVAGVIQSHQHQNNAFEQIQGFYSGWFGLVHVGGGLIDGYDCIWSTYSYSISRMFGVFSPGDSIMVFYHLIIGR